MMTREDGTVTIEYRDGSFYTQFEDGTQFRVNAEKNEIRIEKDGFAPIIKHFKESYMSEETTLIDPSTESDANPLKRAFNQSYWETLLPDKSSIISYTCKYQGGNDYETWPFHIIHRQDLTVVVIECYTEKC